MKIQFRFIYQDVRRLFYRCITKHQNELREA